jgi:hypothetical protein
LKKILFNLIPLLDHSDIPKPAKKYIPSWYRKSEMFSGGKMIDVSGKNSKTIKGCMPFFDSLTSGYIYESPMDIYVEWDDHEYPVIKWALDNVELMAGRSVESMQLFPAPEGYFPEPITFKHPLYIKTPPGYSVIMTNPFNRFDSPFLFLSAIVDTDKTTMYPGNYPIYVKKGFTGIVPKGTPLFQIIPFKRESWTSEKNENILKEGIIANKLAGSTFIGWYKKNIWSRKNYD